MNAYILANPKSGRGQASKYMMTVNSELQKCGYKTYLNTTEPNADLNIKKIRKNINNYDLIVCIGGDGTLNETLNGYMQAESNVPMIYIPCGTTNDFARTLKIKKEPLKAIEKLVAIKPGKIDVGNLNGRYFSYVAAAGVFSEVSYATSRESKRKLGHLAYLLEGVKSLGNIKPLHLKIKSGNKLYEGKYLVCLISNATSIGGVFHLKKIKISLDDGLFEVFLIKEPSNNAEYTALFFDLILENYKNKNIQVFNSKKLIIESKEEISWSLDGEFGGTFKQTNIEIFRKKLNIYL